jgi:N-acetylmuramoyl-L-alanine amidase
MSLFISAGHHPAAPGAAWKGFVEHAEARLWVAEISRHLPAAQLVPSLELGAKIRWINARARPADLAVEVHFNAATPTARGSETLHAPGSGRGAVLAVDVQAVLARFFLPNRGIKPGWYQANPSKGPLAFLAKTRCAALILEPEFIYRADEIRANRAACCAALANTLRRHV